RNSRNTPNQGRAGQAYAWRSAGCSDEIRPQSKQRFASFCLGEMPEALPALQEIQNGGFSGFAEVVFLDPGANGAAPHLPKRRRSFVEICLRDRYSSLGADAQSFQGIPGSPIIGPQSVAG
ncbi:hypothetical protein ACOSLY_006057, partial [Pseudomonas aeruginosa]